MPLSDTKVRVAKPQNKPYKLSDEKGLFLFITPTNGRYWRFKYRFAGKEKKLAVGVYPDLSLAEAREKRDEARRLLGSGIDPSFAKQVAKQASKVAAENSFEAIAMEWYAKVSPQWVPRHAERVLGRLKNDVFPWLGSRPISDISASELLSVLRRIENRGAAETARKTHQTCTQVLRYAIVTGRAERNPSNDLKEAL